MRLGFFDGDDAVLADLVHRFGDDLADRLVVVRRDGADLRDHVAADRLRHLLQLGGDRLDGLLDAALDVHRVRAGDDVLRAFAVDGLRQHGRGGGAVAGDVGRLARDFADHLRAHVLERVLQVDFLGDRHAVLGDGRRSELLVEDDVAALGAEGDLDRVGQLVDAAQHGLPRLLAVHNLLCHFLFSCGRVVNRPAVTPRPCAGSEDPVYFFFLSSLSSMTAEDFVLAHDEVFLAIELDFLAGVLAEQDEVAGLDVERRRACRRPWPCRCRRR